MNKLLEFGTILLILFFPILLIDDIILLDSIRGTTNLDFVTFKRTYDHLCKYKYALNNKIPNDLEPNGKYKNCIWTLWLQGEKNAPGLVKNCFKNMRRYSNGRKVMVLDENSMLKYISLPQHVIDKYRNGNITPICFSDIVRYCLLYKYGGTWIDSTVLLTNKLPNEIVNLDFFMFQIARRYIAIRHFCPVTNWFIHTKPGNPLIKDLINLLFEYWKHEDKAIRYIFSYYFVTIAAESDPKAKETLDKLPYVPEQWHFPIYIRRPFTQKLFNRLKGYSHFGSIHKLTYKVADAPKGSLFEYLSQENLSD